MLNAFVKDTEHIYLAIGITDFRKQVDGLVAVVNMQFKLDPFSPASAFIIDGQMNLFETTIELAKELFNEQKKITVSGYTKVPRQPGVRAEMLAGLPKEIEEYIILIQMNPVLSVVEN